MISEDCFPVYRSGKMQILASRENDEVNGLEPRVALSESGNPGLNDAILSGL